MKYPAISAIGILANVASLILLEKNEPNISIGITSLIQEFQLHPLIEENVDCNIKNNTKNIMPSL